MNRCIEDLKIEAKEEEVKKKQNNQEIITLRKKLQTLKDIEELIRLKEKD